MQIEVRVATRVQLPAAGGCVRQRVCRGGTKVTPASQAMPWVHHAERMCLGLTPGGAGHAVGVLHSGTSDACLQRTKVGA
jgi:hypothetical protein